MMNVIGRNKPCHCGSGKKYKKCCMGKDQQPVPKEVIDYFTKLQAEQEYMKCAGIHINYVKPIIFQGKKVWALGNLVYADGNTNETFHTFLIHILKAELGQDWLSAQSALPREDRHFIALCLEKLGEWIERNQNTAKRINGNVWGAKPDGYGKTLLLLAFDVCSLIHTQKLPKSLLARLKLKEHYQGARYEIAIAAIFARLGCDIQFTDEKSRVKRCEFTATHRETKFSLAVEAKSKKRNGVLHELGLLPTLEKLLSARVIRRMFTEALQQNPKDTPFATFIDINAPLTPKISMDDKQWVKDAKKLVTSKLKDLPPEKYPLNAAFFTNFSYHYQTENEADQGEACGIVIPHPKFPPPSPEFFGYLQGALAHYGFVPAIDIGAPIEPAKTP